MSDLRPTVHPKDIKSAVLETDEARITVLSLGCVVQDWRVRDRSVILGYADPADYIENPVAMGMVLGRVANRISDGVMTVDGTTHALPKNGGAHHIHGGPGGFGWRNWTMEQDGNAVHLTLHSPDGDQGYPGAVDAQVTMTLTGATLRYDIRATVDRPCPLNLAQHLYFNLMGAGDVMDHQLELRAGHYTPNRVDLVPEGRVVPVDGTRYDFRQMRRLGDADPDRLGTDGNVVLAPNGGPAATLRAPDGTQLTLRTDQPGIQVYTSVTLGAHGTPIGAPHAPFGAVCLEAQGYPDALTHGFSSTLCGPDTPYSQTTEITII